MPSTQSAPLVSVSMLAYNHENYISDAIESVLSQRTNFNFKLIIGDDCSTDRTAEILLQYSQKYPDKIKLVLHKKNVGILENSASVARFYEGKYLSPLDGDDYFVDDYKLQKQADFLESNPDFYCVAAKYRVIDQFGNPSDALFFNSIKNYANSPLFTLESFQEYKMAGLTSTMMYRRFGPIIGPRALNAYNMSPAMGDRKLNLVLSALGPIKCFDDVVTAYRVREGSFSLCSKKYCNNFYAYYEMDELACLAREMFGLDLSFTNPMLKAWFGTVIEFITNPNTDNANAVRMIYHYGDDQIKKIIFVITHILGFPFRKIEKLFANK